MSKLWTPGGRGTMRLPGVWLPRRIRDLWENRPVTRPSRAQIRLALRVRKTRKDGSPYTKPSLESRALVRLRRNRVAKAARKENHK
jgi:hypothetical protein